MTDVDAARVLREWVDDSWLFDKRDEPWTARRAAVQRAIEVLEHDSGVGSAGAGRP
jgi:hypothetical protein